MRSGIAAVLGIVSMALGACADDPQNAAKNDHSSRYYTLGSNIPRHDPPPGSDSDDSGTGGGAGAGASTLSLPSVPVNIKRQGG